MSFPEAIKTCIFQKYADFNGRAERSEYWWFYLFNVLLVIGVSLIGQFAGEAVETALTVVIGLGLLLPNLGVCVRRLHDINRSGWWVLIVLIPLLGWIWLLVLTLLKSDEGPNNYGV